MSEQLDLRTVLLADLAQNWRYRGRTDAPASWFAIARCLADVRFLPVVLLRLSVVAAHRGSAIWRLGSQMLSMLNRMVFGVEAATQTSIGPGLYFPHTGGIVIGANRIGARCVIYHQVTLGAKTIDMAFTRDQRPDVGDDVVIAAGAKVLGGVSVGAGSVVAANAVVVDNVIAGSVVGGIPAAPLRSRKQ